MASFAASWYRRTHPSGGTANRSTQAARGGETPLCGTCTWCSGSCCCGRQRLCGDHSQAFGGGTALRKMWRVRWHFLRRAGPVRTANHRNVIRPSPLADRVYPSNVRRSEGWRGLPAYKVGASSTRWQRSVAASKCRHIYPSDGTHTLSASKTAAHAGASTHRLTETSFVRRRVPIAFIRAMFAEARYGGCCLHTR